MREICNNMIKPMLCEVLAEIDKFCKQENIEYSLAYGTLLGAIRHKGFIPWDDDIDIIMLRNDYERFIRSFRHPKMQLVNHQTSADYPYPFSKIHNSKTLVIEESDSSNTFGLYVDVFPIDGLPTNKYIRKYHIYKMRFLKELIDIKNMSSVKDRSIAKNFITQFVKSILKPLSLNSILNLIDRNAKKYAIGNSDYAANLVWETTSAKWKAIPLKYFRDLIQIPFEEKYYQAIGCYDQWLSLVYGDYMRLPPVDKQVSNHMFKAFML